MPRQPDPDLEDRIVTAAHALWKRGGEKALTMRGVARAAGTNTPAMYRRFKNRRELVQALVLRTVARLQQHFAADQNLEGMAEAYIEDALRVPHEYELFYAYGHELMPAKTVGRVRQIRESRPNFAFVEKQLAKRLGGSPQDHTRLALALWATLHGTVELLLAKSIPEEQQPELRAACRAAVKTLIEEAATFSAKSDGKHRARARQ
jgi:AcrR family transcriptional regulator